MEKKKAIMKVESFSHKVADEDLPDSCRDVISKVEQKTKYIRS